MWEMDIRNTTLGRTVWTPSRQGRDWSEAVVHEQAVRDPVASEGRACSDKTPTRPDGCRLCRNRAETAGGRAGKGFRARLAYAVVAIWFLCVGVVGVSEAGTTLGGDISRNTPIDPRAEGLLATASGDSHAAAGRLSDANEYVAMLFVFVLATFVGLDVIRRVSRLLHTPLMSLTNAISAVAVVGALLVAGSRHGDDWTWINTLGLVAMAASMTNIVSGFLITDRMLKMFRKREERKP